MKVNTQKLDLAMATACLRAKELCEKSGISKATLALIRGNEGNPKPQTIGKLAKALGVPVAELIEQEG